MIVSLDTETHLIDRAQLAPKPVCISYACDKQDWPAGVGLVDDLRGFFVGCLKSEHTLLGTNIAYDMAVLGEYWPELLPAIFEKYERGQIQDINLNEKILQIATKGRTEPAYSLESLCLEYGVPCEGKDGPWRTDFARLDGVPIANWPAGAVEYVLGDAAKPLLVHAAQQAVAKKWQERTGYPVLHLAGVEAYKAFCLHLMSCWGIHTHPERTKKFHARLIKFLEQARVDLIAAKLVREDGSRDTKLAKARMIQVCADLGIDVPKTETGGVCLDKVACQDSHDTLLQQYSAYSQNTTLLSRANDLMQGFELPLQVRFDSLLETSRTSTSKPSPPLIGVQAQNFPKAQLTCRVCGSCLAGKKCKDPIGPRECLTPRPGYRFLVCDLPMAELHSLAQVCMRLFGKSSLAETLNAGKDVHCAFTGHMLNMDYEDVYAKYKGGDAHIKAERDKAKPCIYGFMGGLGLDSFRTFAWRQYKQKLTMDECAHRKQVWFSFMPEMRPFFDWVNTCSRGRDYQLVRHVMTGRFRGRVKYCGACNTQFQELTATGASAGLVQVSRECYTVQGSPLWGSRPVMYTHDETVTETRSELCEAGAPRLALLMQEQFNVWHPDVPVKGLTSDIVDIYTKG